MILSKLLVSRHWNFIEFFIKDLVVQGKCKFSRFKKRLLNTDSVFDE